MYLFALYKNDAIKISHKPRPKQIAEIASLATVHYALLISQYTNKIDDVEFACLYGASSSRLTFPYYKLLTLWHWCLGWVRMLDWDKIWEAGPSATWKFANSRQDRVLSKICVRGNGGNVYSLKKTNVSLSLNIWCTALAEIWLSYVLYSMRC